MLNLFQRSQLCQMDDINNSRRKRLRILINTLNIKHKDFAERIGKKPAVLSQLLNGYRNISADFAYEVANCYSWFNPEWLISGKGDMKRTESVGEIYQIEPPINELNEPSELGYGLIEQLQAEVASLRGGLEDLKKRFEEFRAGEIKTPP